MKIFWRDVTATFKLALRWLRRSPQSKYYSTDRLLPSIFCSNDSNFDFGMEMYYFHPIFVNNFVMKSKPDILRPLDHQRHRCHKIVERSSTLTQQPSRRSSAQQTDLHIACYCYCCCFFKANVSPLIA